MSPRTDENVESLIDELSQARRYTDRLFERVPQTQLYDRPIPERHRIAFYLGHLDAFDVNLLLHEPKGAPRFASAFDRLFAFGIDPIEGALPSDTAEDWPVLANIREYVGEACERLDRWLSDSPARVVDDVPLDTLLNAAIEHRWMHAETLAYMLNNLSTPKLLRAMPINHREFSDDDTVSIAAGIATLGKQTAERSFGWDNEYQAHLVEVSAFEIDRYMVTNGQYLRFIEAGGYADPQWWRKADWQWLHASQILHPASWRWDDNDWQHVSLVDAIPFQGDWPVYVSFAEASAYAKWIGKQLPSEAQWHRAAYGASENNERSYPWGEDAPSKNLGNFDFDRWDPMPVDAYPRSASAFGVSGLLGNGWEWTTTPFAPFTQFEPYSFYRGYSADFFDGRHFVLKGGSAHTAARLLRRSFRNWFQPHYPYPFAGFRCVSNL